MIWLVGAALFGVLAACTYLVVMIVVVRLPRRCPACAKRALGLERGAARLGRDEQGPVLVEGYRCRACATQYRRYNRGGLVDKRAWDAGSREPPPTARVEP